MGSRPLFLSKEGDSPTLIKLRKPKDIMDSAPPKFADFRSDTVTKPSAGMRKAMAEAAVGDDVWGDDPTVNSLQIRVA